jgi:hypothetical protein
MTTKDVLLGFLDEAFDSQAWHGPTLRGALRGVRASVARRRPAPGRHSVWELTVHCAYWKYAVRRRLTGEKRGSFARDGSNWFPLPSVGRGRLDRAWRADVALLIAEHKKLRAVVARLPQSRIAAKASGRSPSVLKLVRGIAAHDLYHAGQIQLVKRLVRPRV